MSRHKTLALRTFGTSTRLPGHGLLSEGLPYERWPSGEQTWRRTDWWEHTGYALCSCGAASPEPLKTNGARKRWHRVHKEEIRREREERS